jgi:diguanylate cyclase (GGDEF)-like protein
MPFSLKAKTNFAIALVLSILATMGWLSFKESRRWAEQDRWASHSRDVLDLSESLRSHFADAGAAWRAHVVDESPAQIPLFDSANRATLTTIAALRQAVADNPSQEARLAQLDLALRERLLLFQQSLNFRQGTMKDEKRQEAISEQGLNLTYHASDELRTFDDAERRLLQERVADAQATSRRVTRINELSDVGAALFLIIAVWIVNRELSRRSRAEIAVGKERKLMASILNSCSDVVLVANEMGKVILSNPAADRVFQGITVGAFSDDLARILGMYGEDGVTPFAPQDVPLMRAVRGESVDAVELYVRQPDMPEGRCFLAAGGPLLDDLGDRRGGVIFLRDITQRKLDSERLMAALCESERITRESTELAKLTDLFQSCQSVEEACKVVAALCGEIFDSNPGMLCLTNSSRNLVEGCAKWCDCVGSKELFEPNDCWGLRQGKPYVGGDATARSRCSHVVRLGSGYLCVPLIAQGETYGVLYLEQKPALPGSSAGIIANQKERLHHLATAVAERISLAVANLTLREVLRHQSIQDPLTGLFNRRYLEQSLDREVHRADRARRNVSVVMLDIDHFKRFNDTFGHQSGDLLVKEVAAVIKARVRSGDLACRYGGEEFALILAETDTTGARVCVEKIREAVKQLAVHFRGQSLGSVTISAGIAAFPGHGDKSEELIHMADMALYRAKKEGRDRVVVGEEHQAVSQCDAAL